MDNSSLIYKVVFSMENRESLGQRNWLSTVEFILRYCGMEEIWLNPDTIKNGSVAPKCSVMLRSKIIGPVFYITSTQGYRIESQQENAFVGYSFILKYMI